MNFETCCNGEMWKGSKILFSMSKIIRIFLNFFSLKNTNLGALLILLFDNINFWITLLLKCCSIFDSLPLHQFSKFNDFRWVCWFLGKNLSNFVPPAWKLDNLYYHKCTYLVCENKRIKFHKSHWVGSWYKTWQKLM